MSEADAPMTFVSPEGSPLILSAASEIRWAALAASVGVAVHLVINLYHQWMRGGDGCSPGKVSPPTSTRWSNATVPQSVRARP